MPFDPSSDLGRANPIKLLSLIADRLLAATTQVRRPAHYATARADARSCICLMGPCFCPLTAILRAQCRGTQAAFDKVQSRVRHFGGVFTFTVVKSVRNFASLAVFSLPGPTLSLVLRVAGFNSQAGLSLRSFDSRVLLLAVQGCRVTVCSGFGTRIQ